MSSIHFRRQKTWLEAKQSAKSFFKLTGHWPNELVAEEKYHPLCWSRKLLMLLLALANQRRRAGYNDREDFAGFQEFVMGYIMDRVNGPPGRGRR